MNWHKWIGLPHEFGADPEDGVAADCVVMTWRVLDSAEIHHPEFNPYWLELAQTKNWRELERLWRNATIELEQPQEYAVTLFRNGPKGLGVGIVVDRGLLMVHHKRGVAWVPLDYMPNIRFYVFH